MLLVLKSYMRAFRQIGIWVAVAVASVLLALFVIQIFIALGF